MEALWRRNLSVGSNGELSRGAHASDSYGGAGNWLLVVA